MAEAIGTAGSGHPNLSLTTDEKRVYPQLLKEADPDGFGVVSGDVAVKFFERTKLPPDVLGQIWQIADTENRGFLTPSGFGIVLRLIGHAQAGRTPSAQIAAQPAPLPRFDDPVAQAPMAPPPSLQQAPLPASPSQAAQPPIRVPALGPEKVAEYSALFDKSGAENGALNGVVAKQIFERARLPNEVLGRIWGLSDTQGRGSLDVTEFVIAMHLLASYKSGAMRGVPSTLPPGLYEAATRRPAPRMGSGSRPTSSGMLSSPFQPQQTGFSNILPQSPIIRQQMGTPLSAQSTGEGWVISPAEKTRFDQIFTTVDKQGRGFITGEQAVEFFGNARLPEEVLAQIWDLADINSEGQLNKDEFAVAMYLIRQQRGTRDGRGNLPQSLPPALVPPSMRKQQVAPSQPTAPAFENAPVTKPRSAADDLFGLDAFGPPPQAAQQVALSTGGTDAGPFANPPATTSPPTSFKPFVPSSSFGQSIIPQSTGSPAPTQARSVPAPAVISDDLLGDADPEVSSKLTNETTELANLSNQVGNLSKQMTEVQNTRAQTDQELTQSTMQKRAFEGRLAQLRSLYENEVKEVKTLQEKLTASRNDTKRLQQDMAIIDATHQDLSTQHQQLRAAFEADQRENGTLKERIRQVNIEVDQLKPQLEKLKSDARQHKGLVVINKKQLATNEFERDRIRAEMAVAQRQVENAAREAEESSRQVETSKREIEEARNVPVPPSIKSPPNVASPAPSTGSNPFFRRTATGSSDPAFSPPPNDQKTPTDTRSTFDNLFGPSFGTAAAAGAPSTSFRSSSPAQAGSIPAASASVESPASFTAPEIVEPPAPPQSKQITSAALPFRTPLSRGDSVSSSVKVAPPTSRLSPADTPRALTPNSSTPSPPGKRENDEDPFTAAAPDEEQESVKRTLPTSSENQSMDDLFGSATDEKLSGIPGAFPGGDTPRSGTPRQGVNPTAVAVGAGAATLAAGTAIAAATVMNGDDTDKDKVPEQSTLGETKPRDANFDEFFGGPAHQRTPSEQAADFDSAFASMKQPSAANGTAKPASNQEFPDIQELDDESSEDSDDTPLGFEDNFNSNSPKNLAKQSAVAAGKQPEVASAIPGHLQALRPGFQSTPSTASSLPDFEQQTSPPGYADVVPEDNPTHFPREYKGLLPEREDPTSPTLNTGASAQVGPGSATEPPAYGPEVVARRSISDSHPPVPPPKTSPFDFDSAFAGVGPAQVEDDSDDENDAFKSSKANPTEFNPTFDSPQQSRSTTAASNAPFTPVATNGPAVTAKDAFQDFTPTQAPVTTNAAAPSDSHDWDDIFSGLGKNAPNPALGFGNEPAAAVASSPAGVIAPDTAAKSITEPAPSSSLPPISSPPAPAPKPAPPKRPEPGRAISMTTEHDDPILKRLTAMGWTREESLAALEKYDYDIDKAADYLTFRS